MNLADLLPGDSDTDTRIPGVVVALVTDTQDPQGLGRIKVEFPLLVGDQAGSTIETDWVRFATFFSGKERGGFFLPNEGDEVLVAFEYGNVNQPYVVGFLWNGRDKPPVAKALQQDVREIKTEAGHVIRFDDTKNKESIEVRDKRGNRVLIDSRSDRITVEAKKKVAVKATSGVVSIDAKEVRITASSKLSLKGRDVSVQGMGSVKITAPKVDIN